MINIFSQKQPTFCTWYCQHSHFPVRHALHSLTDSLMFMFTLELLITVVKQCLCQNPHQIYYRNNRFDRVIPTVSNFNASLESELAVVLNIHVQMQCCRIPHDLTLRRGHLEWSELQLTAYNTLSVWKLLGYIVPEN